MTSRRQRRRAALTEQFWREKLARVDSPFWRAHAWYDRARAEAAGLPPSDRAEGLALIRSTLADLNNQFGSDRAQRLWHRWVDDAAASPRVQVWRAWRRLWAVIRGEVPPEEQDAAWDVVQARMEALVVTFSNWPPDASSHLPSHAEPALNARARARVRARAKRNTRNAYYASSDTHRNHREGN